MEPSKEAIAVRITRLNRQILGKVTSGSTKFTKKTIDREALLDALTALYDECNDDPIKKTDELVRVYVDKCKILYQQLCKYLLSQAGGIAHCDRNSISVL